MSSLVFNAEEVLEIAKRIEQNGAAYYRAAEAFMPDAAGKQLMRDFVEMEVNHENVFEQMRQELTDDERAETLYDPHDDAYVFLQGMADGFVFNPNESPKTILREGTDPASILRVAIEREKDSVVFYEAIKVMVPQKFGNARLDAIIGEELGHIVTLSRELAKYRA